VIGRAGTRGRPCETSGGSCAGTTPDILGVLQISLRHGTLGTARTRWGRRRRSTTPTRSRSCRGVPRGSGPVRVLPFRFGREAIAIGLPVADHAVASIQQTSVTGVRGPAELAGVSPRTAMYSSRVTGYGASRKASTSTVQFVFVPSSRRTISPEGIAIMRAVAAEFVIGRVSSDAADNGRSRRRQGRSRHRRNCKRSAPH
jgi:hypothetical protein